eukprot:230180-Prorocentrum_minimum.AAC.2
MYSLGISGNGDPNGRVAVQQTLHLTARVLRQHQRAPPPRPPRAVVGGGGVVPHRPAADSLAPDGQPQPPVSAIDQSATRTIIVIFDNHPRRGTF